MADVQVRPLGTETAPADAVIPQSSEWIMKACYASFDGAGAAGSFQPLLRVKSDAGLVVFESKISDTIAAGASADVSWFPGVKEAAAAAASVGLPLASLYYATRTISVVNTDYYATATGGSFVTNDPTTFTLGTVTIGGNDYSGIVFNTAGLYRLTIGTEFISEVGADTFTLGIYSNATMYFSDPLFEDNPVSLQTYNALGGFQLTATAGEATDLLSYELILSVESGLQIPTDALIPYGQNNTSDAGSFTPWFFCEYLGTGTLFN